VYYEALNSVAFVTITALGSIGKLAAVRILIMAVPAARECRQLPDITVTIKAFELRGRTTPVP
jgi:hypothetical protein